MLTDWIRGQSLPQSILNEFAPKKCNSVSGSGLYTVVSLHGKVSTYMCEYVNKWDNFLEVFSSPFNDVHYLIVSSVLGPERPFHIILIFSLVICIQNSSFSLNISILFSLKNKILTSFAMFSKILIIIL